MVNLSIKLTGVGLAMWSAAPAGSLLLQVMNKINHIAAGQKKPSVFLSLPSFFGRVVVACVRV
jgi:hypothetical protein